MQVTVYVYTGQIVTGIRTFRSIRAANGFIAKVNRRVTRRAFIHEVTK